MGQHGTLWQIWGAGYVLKIKCALGSPLIWGWIPNLFGCPWHKFILTKIRSFGSVFYATFYGTQWDILIYVPGICISIFPLVLPSFLFATVILWDDKKHTYIWTFVPGRELWKYGVFCWVMELGMSFIVPKKPPTNWASVSNSNLGKRRLAARLLDCQTTNWMGGRVENLQSERLLLFLNILADLTKQLF